MRRGRVIGERGRVQRMAQEVRSERGRMVGDDLRTPFASFSIRFVFCFVSLRMKKPLMYYFCNVFLFRFKLSRAETRSFLALLRSTSFVSPRYHHVNSSTIRYITNLTRRTTSTIRQELTRQYVNYTLLPAPSLRTRPSERC